MPRPRKLRIIEVELDDDERSNTIGETFRDAARSYRVYKAASRSTRLVVGLLVISFFAGLITYGAGGPEWLSTMFSVIFSASLLAILAVLGIKLVRNGARRFWQELKEIVG